MTIEANQETIRFDGSKSVDQYIVQALATSALAVERFGSLHELENYDPWEQEDSPQRVDALSADSIQEGLRYINPHGSFDEDHLEISVRTDEVPELLGVVQEAEDLMSEGKVVNLRRGSLTQARETLQDLLAA